jgi:hypothetical protein
MGALLSFLANCASAFTKVKNIPTSWIIPVMVLVAGVMLATGTYTVAYMNGKYHAKLDLLELQRLATEQSLEEAEQAVAKEGERATEAEAKADMLNEKIQGLVNGVQNPDRSCIGAADVERLRDLWDDTPGGDKDSGAGKEGGAPAPPAQP